MFSFFYHNRHLPSLMSPFMGETIVRRIFQVPRITLPCSGLVLVVALRNANCVGYTSAMEEMGERLPTVIKPKDLCNRYSMSKLRQTQRLTDVSSGGRRMKKLRRQPPVLKRSSALVGLISEFCI